MKPMHRQLYLAALSLAFCCSEAFSENGTLGADQIRQINAAIQAKGAKWVAGENWVTKLSPDERERLFMKNFEMPERSKSKLLTLPKVDHLPSVFDWRDNDGNWITPVKNQYWVTSDLNGKTCGSCWDFAAVAQVESWWKIRNQDPDAEIDLSEQFILTYGNAGSCGGGSSELALDFIHATGVPPEECFPYQAVNSPLGSDVCPDWKEKVVKIPGWGYITLEEAITENIKNAIYRQPVNAYMMVYGDFISYSSGVYEHVAGNAIAGHMVLIIGWNDLEQSWICKNSLGEEWGDGGYFRIKWGDCGIGQFTDFIWDEVIGGSDFSIKPNPLNVSLFYGDSLSKNIKLSNTGSKTIEYSAFYYELNPSAKFHIDSFNAYDGGSIWCGDAQLRGYNNGWLQYMDLPVMNLIGTNNPKLTFMGCWSMEEPPNLQTQYDGWDGCNVWLSIDNGKSFRVARPLSMEYNCQNLYSFGSVWGLGDSIPGWGGKSDGWKQVEFDLSPFKADSLIIRFSFASDFGTCTKTNKSLQGFFIDEIGVVDKEKTLFENHGDTLLNIRTMGYDGGKPIGWIDPVKGESITDFTYYKPAGWIVLANGVGIIKPGDSTWVNIQLNTKTLTPGRYGGMISFAFNDSVGLFSQKNLLINMEARKPNHDIALLPTAHNMPLFINENNVFIKNYGLHDETDFDVVFSLMDAGNLIYSDMVNVPLLNINEIKRITFRLMMAIKDKEFDREVTITNVVDDYNSFNNHLTDHVKVSNLVDDFETQTGFWGFQGGWGITNVFGGHSGPFAAQVNSGKRYEPNMDAVMTFEPGFNFHGEANPVLKFWTMYQTITDKDVLYVESSSDSLTWVKMDSLTGNNSWTQEEVNLTPIVQSGGPTVWLRFHFISRSTKNKMGFLIDDVEIYAGGADVVDEKIPSPGNSMAWNLVQNYPNPFNASTEIRFTIRLRSHVTLKVFDLLGREVATLRDEMLPAGAHSVVFDASNLTTGVYFVRISAGEFKAIKKLLVIR